MDTLVLRVDPDNPDPAAIARGSHHSRGRFGGISHRNCLWPGSQCPGRNRGRAHFPGEGTARQQPRDCSRNRCPRRHKLTAHWPETATQLAAVFWPGPLTMVLPKNDSMPAIVTASGPTVGLRVPAQPTALALLQACDVPLAAPSANRSSQLSPTCGAHVLEGLNGRIDLLLDAGPTSGGLESTVLDLTSTPPVLLRPGLISKREIEAIVGPLRLPGRYPMAHRSNLQVYSTGITHRARRSNVSRRMAAPTPGICTLKACAWGGLLTLPLGPQARRSVPSCYRTPRGNMPPVCTPPCTSSMPANWTGLSLPGRLITTNGWPSAIG